MVRGPVAVSATAVRHCRRSGVRRRGGLVHAQAEAYKFRLPIRACRSSYRTRPAATRRSRTARHDQRRVGGCRVRHDGERRCVDVGRAADRRRPLPVKSARSVRHRHPPRRLWPGMLLGADGAALRVRHHKPRGGGARRARSRRESTAVGRREPAVGDLWLPATGFWSPMLGYACALTAFASLSATIRRGRSDPGSSPCPTLPRSPSRTFPSRPRSRRLRRSPAAASWSRRRDRRAYRST
jgi:hypothetical protein